MLKNIAVYITFLTGLIGSTSVAHAHVKWFAPYIVRHLRVQFYLL